MAKKKLIEVELDNNVLDFDFDEYEQTIALDKVIETLVKMKRDYTSQDYSNLKLAFEWGYDIEDASIRLLGTREETDQEMQDRVDKDERFKLYLELKEEFDG